MSRTDPELIRRAEAAGIAPRYRDSRDQEVEVSAETFTAILDALDSVPGAAGPGRGEESGGQAGLARPRIPERRSWGLTVQLYSVRSRRSWGHGDLHDLADLAAWCARELGAGFILINPLHAAEPAPPVSNSPYLPMTRRYLSPLYLRIEDIEEYRRLNPAQRQ